MSAERSHPAWRTMRWLPLGTAAIGVIAVLAAGGILTGIRQDAARRETLQLYHLQSEVIAQQIAMDTARLRESAYSAPGRPQPQLIAIIRQATKRIVAIQDEFAHADADRAVKRLAARVERVSAAFGASAGEDFEIAPLLGAIDSLALAARQLERLHVVDARNSIDAQGDPLRTSLLVTLFAAGVIALVSFAASRWLVLAVRKSVEQDQAAADASREALAHSRKIEALGQLAGGVAHDFNNLLTVILGNAESLRHEIEEGSPLQDGAREIEKAGEQAAALTRQLLSFSRREVQEVRAVDLNEIIREAETMLRRLMREDIVFEIRLEDGLGLIRGDPVQLRQLILNLILNARDALPDGGVLGVETAKHCSLPEDELVIAASASGPAAVGGYARLTVGDDGIGIPVEIRNRVFDPYFTTKAKGEGTGLGLATVLAVVRECGGSIAVQSEKGVGTRFDVYLPLTAGDDLSTDRSVASPEPDGSETILVVEDQASLRRLTARLLSEAGFVVISAADGVEALRVCRERSKQIDLILTDVVMPNVTGIEIADRAKETHPEARILFMSGYADDDHLLKRLRASPERLLRKPFRRDELLERVRSILSEPS